MNRIFLNTPFRGKGLLSFVVALSMLSRSDILYANPSGANIIEGTVTLQNAGKKLDIHQSTDKAIIEWQEFNIQADEHTQFHQPSSSSLTLNRIKDENPSQILGKLSANGNVVLVNPNGVFFGKDATVDVNSLIATTADIQNKDFMMGNLKFSKRGNPNGSVVNYGRITAKEAGLVGLVAPNVENHGVINAHLSKVALASGDSFVADLYGDGLVEIKLSDKVTEQLVVNTGDITAEGGTIAITAAAGKEIVNSLVSISGELKAPTVKQQGGKIIIAAEGSNAVKDNIDSDKGKKSGTSTVIVGNAYLDASGTDTGEQGGQIEITADNILIADNTIIDASGHSSKIPSTKNATTGTATLTADKQVRTEEEFLTHDNRAGGSIKIGGDYLGTQDTAAAEYVYVSPYSLIINDAIISGDAGRTIIWSDKTTDFYGNIFGRGGIAGGHGGFVETSGKENLIAQGYVDLTAAKDFNKGTYLLDPTNITIYGNVDPTFTSTDSTIDLDSNLRLWLDAADASKVELTYSSDSLSSTTATGTSGTNTITTSADVSSSLEVGARIRLTSSGSITTADTLGSDTYTITNISGTILTVAETLTANYTSDTLYRGLVSTWFDSSDGANHATQSVEGTMPLWISNGLNGNGVISLSDQRLLSGTNSDSWRTFFGTALRSGTGWDYLWGNNLSDNRNVRAIGSNYVDGNSKDFAFSNAYYVNGEQTDLIPDNEYHTVNTEADSNLTFTYGVSNSFMSRYWDGDVADIFVYNTTLSSDARHLAEQYQSAKWDIALTGPGTGGDEVTQATASDGYNVFAAEYLNRLSETADIVLVADADIDLDLQGANLTLTDDRSITLTAGADINTLSGGTITTNRTGSGGNITFDAVGDINIDHALTLNAQNGGVVTLDADGTFNINNDFDVTSGSLTLASDIDILSNANITFYSNDDLTLNNAITKSSGSEATLTLKADNSIFVNADITSSSDELNVILHSDADNNEAGAITVEDANITSNGGDITLGGGSDPLVDYAVGTLVNDDGIVLDNSDLTAGIGNISLYGQGDNDSGANLYGVYAGSGSQITTITGDITINGLGGFGAHNNFGMWFKDSNTLISSSEGNITLTGEGGDGHLGRKTGIYLANNAMISSTGTGANAATITLNATGGSTTFGNYGVHLDNGDVTSIDGDILINADGGDGSARDNYGLFTAGGAQISSTGTGGDAANITIIATGGDGGTYGNYGIYHTGSAVITSVDGDISVSGAGGDGSDTDNYGFYITGGADITNTGSGDVIISAIKGIGTTHDLYIDSSGTTIGSSTATGDITLNLDDYNFTSAPSFETTGTVTIQPYTINTTIGVAGGAGDLNLSSAFLGYLDSGVSDIVIGRTDGTGAMDIAAHDWNGENVTFRTDTGNIDFSGAQTNFGTLDILTNTAFTLDQAITHASHVLVDAVGDVTIDSTITKDAGSEAILELQSDNSIFVNGDIISLTDVLNITLHSDSDNDEAGSITVKDANITSNGGDITLGGGSDPMSDYAVGTVDDNDGIILNNTDLTAALGIYLFMGMEMLIVV